MTWRHPTTRDPVLLMATDQAPDGFAPATRVEARIVAILGVEENAPFVVRLRTPSALGLDDDIGLHLTPGAVGTAWRGAGVVEVRRFRFPPDSPALQEGTVSDVVEGRLAYETCAFDLAEVFAEAEEGGGSRMLNDAELSRLVDYARTRDAAVTFVETYELSGALEIARTDLSLYGLDGEDEGLSDVQRLDLAAGYVSEVLALAQAEEARFGYRTWVWSNANR